MNSVLDAIVKLPRYIKILSTNGIDENTAIVLNDNDNDENNNRVKRNGNGYNKESQQKYYSKNRDWILQKKKEHNKLPEVKQRSSEYHKNYYLDHKEELNLKHREYSKNRNKKN